MDGPDATEFENFAQAAQSCACINLRKFSRAVTRLFDEALVPCGLTSTQFALLITVAVQDKPTITGLAHDMVIGKTTLLRNLKLREREKLVRIETARNNRHNVVFITANGVGRVREAVPLWSKVQKAFIEAFGDDQWGDLLAYLEASLPAIQVASVKV